MTTQTTDQPTPEQPQVEVPAAALALPKANQHADAVEYFLMELPAPQMASAADLIARRFFGIARRAERAAQAARDSAKLGGR